MTELTAGNVIVARYELNEKVTFPDGDVAMWHAKDKIFNRDVVLFSVADFEPDTADGALDRAREAAQISVAGIARVLDVLESEKGKIIVIERPSGIDALSAISGSTFLVDQAHAVIGELARSLSKANEKGLQHGNLSPNSIWFDGTKITIDGMVARHILKSNAKLSPQEVTERDVLGLSALLYFMLTGLMPQYQEADNDLPRLMTVIPRMTPDLEKLSTGVLNGTHPVPLNVDDFLAQLGQWSPDDLPVIDPGLVAGVIAEQEEQPFEGATAPPVQRASVKSLLNTGRAPGTVPPAPPETSSALGAVGAMTPPAIAPAFGAMAPAGYVTPQPAAPSGASQHTTPPRKFHFNPTALILIVALVVLLWGGNWAVKTLTGDFEPIMVSPTGRPTPADTEDPESPSTEEEKPPEVIVPVIQSARSLDPQGDENEHPELQDNLFDGDSSTPWYSRTYKTAAFSNLKSGIGIALELEQESTVSSILISSQNQGGMVEVRATTADKPTEGTVLASGPLDGETLFTLSEPTQTDSIVLWFTSMPKDQNNNNRFYFYEIGLT